MRLITFTRKGADHPEIGARLPHAVGNQILPFADCAKLKKVANFPSSMKAFLSEGDLVMNQAKSWVKTAHEDAKNILISADEITYLPPIMDAEKFLCVGKNYHSHLAELRRNNLIKEMPEEPTSFIKLNSCLTGHLAEVVRPKGITKLDYEPELVFVIGKRALGAKKDEAMSYVAGVTILNDLTCRDSQLREVISGSRFWTGKNIPGFGPLGPEIVTIDEISNPYDLWMTCSVNGVERMRVSTADQIWKISDILEHFSRFIPIEPGDMFSTGAPGGVAVGKDNAQELYLKPGDVVECSIDGISTLSNTIIDEA